MTKESIIPMLDPARLDRMIDKALTHQQIRLGLFRRIPANDWRLPTSLTATAAVVLLALSTSFMTAETTTDTDLNEIYSEISDYMMSDLVGTLGT